MFTGKPMKANKIGNGLILKHIQKLILKEKEDKFDNEICLFGYISTSLVKKQALKFAF